ncbi:MAG TPA: phosphatase PAP2 family protein [Bryobacteraceae bacterium]|nr:phosphatase PAP2 family protein [Bryobacteraceae bacterium]
MLRGSEWLLIANFAYLSVLALALPVRAPVAVVTLVLNSAIVASYALLAYADSFRRGLLLGAIRDWYPFPLLLLTYREMGWFAQPQFQHHLETAWVAWDRRLLDGGLRALIEALGPVVPAGLEISYALVFALGPLSMAVLFLYRRRDRADRFLFLFLLAVLLSYWQFPFWPSEPPRTVFPGLDMPNYTSPFRRFNWWYLGSQGIHTSVFPSAHVSGAFGAAFGMLRALPERPWAGRFLLVLAVLIATATVYGRYHYFVDAAAGLAVSLAALGISDIRSRAAASTAGREKTIR